MVELGKRLERLLFFTAPITIAAFVALAVAIASEKSSVIRNAPCYALGAKIVSEKLGEFQEAWDESLSERRVGRPGGAYEIAHLLMLGYPEIPIECYEVLRPENDALVKKSPSDLLVWLQKQADVTAKAPLEMYGVALPRSTNIELMGNVVKVELVSFSRMLQIVMFPVLVLWLASLYQTRQRESLYIAEAPSLRDVYPHFMNVYSVDPKKGMTAKHLRFSSSVVEMTRLFFAVMRASLIALFIVPASVAYILSILLTVTSPDANGWTFAFGYAGMVLIFLFALSVVILEFSSKLYARTFVTEFDPGAE